jgi:pyridoxal phosphate enzyme (YggS family)
MIAENIRKIHSELPSGVCLVAVSKFHPVEAILEAYNAGQRVFAESRPQEFAAKVPQLPSDISWHFIGHLQTNKLKKVLPFASLVQSIDSRHLLDAVEAWGAANSRVVDILLEVHISSDAAKQGFSAEETLSILRTAKEYPHVCFRGLMGMATLTDDETLIRSEFARLKALFSIAGEACPAKEAFDTLSMGMSSDWRMAVEEGSTMVRIGTAIFGERE